MPQTEISQEEIDELRRLSVVHLEHLSQFVDKNVPGVILSNEMMITLDLLIRLYGEHAHRAINFARKRVHARNTGKCIKCFKMPVSEGDAVCKSCTIP